MRIYRSTKKFSEFVDGFVEDFHRVLDDFRRGEVDAGDLQLVDRIIRTAGRKEFEILRRVAGFEDIRCDGNGGREAGRVLVNIERAVEVRNERPFVLHDIAEFRRRIILLHKIGVQAAHTFGGQRCAGRFQFVGLLFEFRKQRLTENGGTEAFEEVIEDVRASLGIGFVSKEILGQQDFVAAYFCQGNYGQISPVYSISAGLDYPGIGPEHAYLHDIGRAEYVSATDDEAVEAFEYLSRMEGIIPAIESSHAIAHAMRIAGDMDKDDIVVINVSGRGDKDVAAIARYKGVELYE